MTVYERIIARSVRVGACLIWQGALRGKGYGSIWHGGRLVSVHRVIYEHAHGPIPPGLEITHLEAVTWIENIRRAVSGTAVKHRAQTRCTEGHALESPNLVLSALRRGERACRECALARMVAYRLRRKAA